MAPPGEPTVAVNALNVRPGVVDGAITYTLNLLRELRAARPAWRVVAFVPTGEDRLPAEVETVEVGLARGAAGRVAWESTLLTRALRRVEADVLLAPFESLPVLLPCPAVVVAQNLFHHRPDVDTAFAGGSKAERLATRARTAYYRRRMPAAYRRAAAVIAVSAETARVLQREAGLDPSRTHVVHEGSDSSLLPDVDARERTDRLLAVGALMPYKGHELALEALARHRELQLDIVGEPWRGYEEVLRRRAAELGVAASVRFLGGVGPHELAELYASSLLLLHLSECESFGLPALEAMRYGLPVVAANRSSLPEVVGEAGLVVDPTVDAVSAAIERLISSPAERAALAAAGCARAAAWTWRATAEGVAQVIERACPG